VGHEVVTLLSARCEEKLGKWTRGRGIPCCDRLDEGERKGKEGKQNRQGMHAVSFNEGGTLGASW
jgi:hypothetical protein